MVEVSWQMVKGASGYYVYRSENPYGPYIKQTTVGYSTLSWNDAGLKPSTTYYYKVSAFNGKEEESVLSDYAAATTLNIPRW